MATPPKKQRKNEVIDLRDRCAMLEDALKDRDREIEYLKSDSGVIRYAADYSNEAIIIINQSGKLLFANKKSCELLGYTRMELQELDLADIIHPDVRAALMERLQSRFEGKRVASQYETKLINRRRRMIPIELTAGIINWDGSRADLIAMRDISARRLAEKARERLELQLRQSQKMEAIGTLAGGIAHDFNNILGVITGYTGMALMQDLPTESPVKDYLEEIRTTANRAKDLIRQILAFSRKQDAEKRMLDINILLKETMKMLRASIPSTIQFDIMAPDSPVTVKADTTHVHQIIMNICMNAAQAMPGKEGVIKVSLAVKEVDDADVRLFDLPHSGRFAELVISDNGVGIGKKDLEHLFEPYYTSKPLGQGTGLGLSVVMGLVKDYHGGIAVDSSEGKGTTVTVLLPEYINNTLKKNESREKSITHGSGSVLFVDDEERVVKMTTYMLKLVGYTVHAFNDSLDALNYFRYNPDEVDILITDQTMPHMVGTHLVREVLKIRPGLPVILCTGYRDDDLALTMDETGITRLMVKPISVEDLSEAIFTILNQQ